MVVVGGANITALLSSFVRGQPWKQASKANPHWVDGRYCIAAHVRIWLF